jgi:hypothetical protein
MPTISITTLQKHKVKPLKKKSLIKQLMWQKDSYHPTHPLNSIARCTKR